jgi:hypothetical protein
MQVPEGPAHKNLEPGDVLVRINEEVSTAFNCQIYMIFHHTCLLNYRKH